MITKKRFLSILLSLVMVLGLIPGTSLTALAADTYTIKVNDTTFMDNAELDIPYQYTSGESLSIDSYNGIVSAAYVSTAGANNFLYFKVSNVGDGQLTYKQGTTSTTLTINCTKNTTPVTGVTLSPSNATFTVGGDAVKLTATVLPDNATDKTVKWLFDNKVKLFSDADCTSPITTDTETNILTVYFKGISEGVAVISVVSNTNAEANAQCKVTVAPTTAISPAGAGTVSFTGGDDLQFKATANSGYEFDHWSYSEFAYNPTTHEQQWTE